MSGGIDYSPLLNEIIELLNSIIGMINQHGNNLAAGLRILVYVAVAFLVWQVIRVIYGLFGRVFFGGV